MEIGQLSDWINKNSQVKRVVQKSAMEKEIFYDFSKDKEAVKSYFINHVNKQTQHFGTVEEKVRYMTDENAYWEKEIFEGYTKDEIEDIFNYAFARKFRFPSFMGAFKFYNDYALKTPDKETYLERYEDRLVVVSLAYGDGDIVEAKRILDSLLNQDFTPATPTLLNTGKVVGGEKVSCFLLTVGDSLNDISQNLSFAMELSRLGGGVGLNLNNIRAKTEDIRSNKNVSKGVLGVAKLFDNAFRYADQMG